MKVFKNKFHIWKYKTFYITVPDEAKKSIEKLMAIPQFLGGLDIETAKLPDYKDHPQAGLCPLLSRIRLLQIFDGVDRVYIFDLFHIDFDIIGPLLKTGKFVAHNGIFEIKHFTNAGYPNMNIHCSMLMSQLVEGAEHSPFEEILLPGEEAEENSDQNGLSLYRRTGHSLDAVTQRLFGVKVAKEMQVSDWAKEELTTEQITYAGLDAVLTFHDAKALGKKIKSYKMAKSYYLLKEMQHVVARMELEGLPVDWEYHDTMMKDWDKKSNEALVKCEPYFGTINMRSNKQMSAWLIKYLEKDKAILAVWPRTISRKRVDGKWVQKIGNLSFSKTAIADRTHLPAIKCLLEYKKYSKLLDTYGASLLEKKHPLTGRLHTSYTLGMTTTGRMSSRNPNVQNMPRDKSFRAMFKAEKDHVLIVSDFSQIELRLQAEFSKDPEMCKVYKEGGDVYVTLASKYFGRDITKLSKEDYESKRMFGKVVMLALGYGMGPTKLGTYAANTYGLFKSDKEWMKAHQAYHDIFKVYSAWCKKIRSLAERQGYIQTLTGKRRKLEADEMYTTAPNTVIQGTAAELMMKALLICQKALTAGSIVGTVHDEILIHVHKKDAEKAKDCLASSMNQAMVEMFPKAVSHKVAAAKSGINWAEAK